MFVPDPRSQIPDPRSQIPDPRSRIYPPPHDHHHDGSVYAGVPDPDPPRRQLQKCFPPTAANYVIKGAAYVDFFVSIFLCLAATAKALSKARLTCHTSMLRF